MTEKRRKVGEAGEKAAQIYLEQKGYRIVNTNYRCPLGEIDIIAMDGNTVVIVEVRTKTGKSYGFPEESITKSKASRLKRLALYYIQAVYKHPVPSRIDLVSVMFDKTGEEMLSINHIRNILPG